jgi:hypothetical protein
MSHYEHSTFDENPAVDNTEFAAEWESLQEPLHDDPFNAVGDLSDFIDQVLDQKGIAIDDQVAAGGLDPELVAEVHNLRDIARRTRQGQDVPPADIGGAIEGARLLWQNFQPEAARGGQPVDPAATDNMDLDADAGDIGETRERVEEPPLDRYDAREDAERER